jgi:hypothetical protein
VGTYTIKYHAEVKGNKTLILATVRVNPENITVSKRIQLQRTTYCIIPINEKPQIGKSIEAERKTVVA